MPSNSGLNKTQRQRIEYIRMIKQLSSINNWENKHKHILKKNCGEHNKHIFQLHQHYNLKAIRLKKLLHMN